ncbi:radical SAM protein [candidate division KSB1 bacterium]|nr:radical SAM protein [candidate division KSB1 bacterium]
MESIQSSLKVEFVNSHEKRLVSLQSLIDHIIHFLEHFGEPHLLGRSFCKVIGTDGGQIRFNRLLAAAGYENDPHGFFKHVIDKIEKTNSYHVQNFHIGEITLPYLFVHSILEIVLPGNTFIPIKNVQQLEKVTNISVPGHERQDMQRVLEHFPVRLSMHTIRQMRLSKAIAYQYLPFVDELNEEGFVHTWVGQFHRGIVEQMYRNRIIFVLNMACPVYCRFCFRKHKECRNQKAPKQEHVKNAILYVKNSPDIKEIVLTGGDPFMNRATLTYAIDGLKEIPQVQTLRIATRSISYYPHLFYMNNSFWLNYLKRKYLELEEKGKRIEVATHFIHPDEVSIDALDIISELTQSGITVYIQTPLLNECNDQGDELKHLYQMLRGAGAEMHYIYIPCSPIKGNRRFVAPISRGMAVARYLRAHLSDRAMPRICTATKIGKIDWNLSGWAVEQDQEDKRYIWLRTPYTHDYFSSFAPILQLENFARLNSEGTLDVRYMADIGDPALFWGARQPKSVDSLYPQDQEFYTDDYNQRGEMLPELQRRCLKDQRFLTSLVKTGLKGLARTHKTRVEIDLEAADEEQERHLRYIKENEAITDVVVTGQEDIMGMMYRLKKIIKQLADIDHITAIRCKSYRFNYSPGIYTQTVINELARLNHINMVNPKRLEIETQFLHASEFTSLHKNLAAQLRRKGITVYNNTPLLAFINDTAKDVLELAWQCRLCGIEFHHLYLAGLPIQYPESHDIPVDISILIDIATRLRRYESGRTIPRFMISTALGEVEFGLSSKVIDSDEKGRVLLKLLPYDQAYFKSLDPDFAWPENVRIDSDGYPIIPIPGLKRTPEFFFS